MHNRALTQVDVERAELDVLRGLEARHWGAVRQVVAEVHDDSARGGDNVARVLALLRQWGLSDVTTQQDPALSGTQLLNVYARRPGS